MFSPKSPMEPSLPYTKLPLLTTKWSGAPSFRRPLTLALAAALCCLTVLWLATTPVSRLPGTAQDDTAGAGDADVLTHKHMAVVVESEATSNLVPLMLHFASLLGPSWPVVLFTLEKNWRAPESAAFARAVDEGRVKVRFLPLGTNFNSSVAVSRFLTDEWFWWQLSHADRVLMFQTDSVICANAPAAIADFLAYDLVGAPIDPAYGNGFNGGLSLRNPRLLLDVVRTEVFEGVAVGGGVREYEDQWFYERLVARNANLPAYDDAKKFAVETIYYQTPLGYHQPGRWQAAHSKQIEEYCPEVNMLLDRRVM